MRLVALRRHQLMKNVTFGQFLSDNKDRSRGLEWHLLTLWQYYIWVDLHRRCARPEEETFLCMWQHLTVPKGFLLLCITDEVSVKSPSAAQHRAFQMALSQGIFPTWKLNNLATLPEESALQIHGRQAKLRSPSIHKCPLSRRWGETHSCVAHSQPHWVPDPHECVWEWKSRRLTSWGSELWSVFQSGSVPNKFLRFLKICVFTSLLLRVWITTAR